MGRKLVNKRICRLFTYGMSIKSYKAELLNFIHTSNENIIIYIHN